MCFSPAASFTAGIVLCTAGVVTLRKTKRKEEMPFAMIPLLFGVQQLIEGGIWLTLHDPGPLSVLTFAYALFAHILWPTFIPLSIFLLEKSTWRRKALGICIGVGACVSLYFLQMFLRHPPTVLMVHESLAYVLPFAMAPIALPLYFAATCLGSLFSSHRLVKVFGITAFVSAIAAYELYQQTFASVWCYFAAVLSVIVSLHFRCTRK